MKNMKVGFMVVFFLCIVSIAHATQITSEVPVLTPPSYDNYWSYYYYDLGSYSSSYYFTDVSQFPSVGFEGYVTGDNGPWSPANDSFATLGSEDGHNIHIFSTYIMSSVDQNVIFAAGGNDGHTIFIDDTYTTDTVTNGSTSYGAGAGYNVTAARSLEMAANVSYKITLAGVNASPEWAYWFNVRDDFGGTWVSRLYNAPNISMNAQGDFADPVPEPATMLLFGTGLVGLVGFRLRKMKK